MGNVIVVVALVLIIVFAVKSSAKHFRGEGGCCGGGGDSITKKDIPVKKLDGTKLGEMTVFISGMHCDHCVASVTKAINRIDGASAHVILKKNKAVVSYDREVSEEAVRNAVEAEGFQVTGIKREEA